MAMKKKGITYLTTQDSARSAETQHWQRFLEISQKIA
jgi:hypothetical protein